MSKFFDLQSSEYLDAIVNITSGDVDAGALVEGADVVGFAFTDILDETEGTIIVKANKVVATKEAALAINALDVLYYHATGLNKTAASGIRVGFAIKAALAADTTVEMAFDGTLAETVTDPT
jgi:predicted RecA/RadA family phage recombinase